MDVYHILSGLDGNAEQLNIYIYIYIVISGAGGLHVHILWTDGYG